MSDTISVESRTSRWLSPLILFFATMLLIGATSKDYGVTWDEPPYFHATDLHMRWLADSMENIIWGELRKSLDDQTIKDAWHWNPYNVPHPPFSRIVSGFARYISSLFLGKISAYRLGPALFFALLVTVMFVWMKELFGRATGLFSALAVILTPNLFGYAHIAVTDLPLATMWFITTYSFWKGLRSWKWSVALGIVWGLALATKFPALLIPAPLILWAHLFHRDKYVNNLFALLSRADRHGRYSTLFVAPDRTASARISVRRNQPRIPARNQLWGFVFQPNFTIQSAALVLFVLSCRRNNARANRYSSSAGNGISSLE